jgi:hypothetical protein
MKQNARPLSKTTVITTNNTIESYFRYSSAVGSAPASTAQRSNYTVIWPGLIPP